jgi:hypothetical protein
MVFIIKFSHMHIKYFKHKNPQHHYLFFPSLLPLRHLFSYSSGGSKSVLTLLTGWVHSLHTESHLLILCMWLSFCTFICLVSFCPDLFFKNTKLGWRFWDRIHFKDNFNIIASLNSVSKFCCSLICKDLGHQYMDGWER